MSLKRHVAFILFLTVFSSQVLGFSGGSGTPEDPYEISTCRDLQDLNTNLSSNFELVNNIDCSGTIDWNSGKGFKPIGPDYGRNFSGVLNGNNYTVDGLYVNLEDVGEVGLVGFLGRDGKIKNIGLTNANITGDYFVGGLVGYNDDGGNISNSYVTGKVSNTFNVETSKGGAGGLVGYNNGSIVKSYSKARISGTSAIGGLVGYNGGGNILNSYSEGKVTGNLVVGGLVGSNLAAADISKSYSTGNVSGNGDYTGGLVGSSYGTVSKSYWDTESSGQSSSDGGMGLKTSEMQGSSAQSNMNLDFDSVWVTRDSDYPTLKWNEESGGDENTGPDGTFSFSPSNPEVGQSISFDATDSTDPDGNIASYEWDFDGDGDAERTGSIIEFNFDSAGDQKVILNVTDDDGDVDVTSQYIAVRENVDSNNPPSAKFDFSPNKPKAGETVSFDAGVSNDQDGLITSYRWDFDGDGEFESSGKKAKYSFESPGKYDVSLTVEDNGSAEDTMTKQVDVQKISEKPIEIETVKPEISGTKIEGVSFQNTYEAKISSELGVKKVVFKLNGVRKVDEDGSDGWKKDLDMGILEENSVLRVKAVDKDGNTDVYTSSIAVEGVPEWLENLAETGTVKAVGKEGKIKIYREVPNPPVDASLSVPGAVPIVGGEQRFEASSRFGVTYHMEDGKAVVLGEGELDMKIAGREARGLLGAQGTINTNKWQLRSAKVYAEVEVEAWSTSYELGTPYFSPEVDVGVSPKTRVEIYLDNSDSGLQVTRGAVEPGIKAEGILATETRGVRLSGKLVGEFEGHIEVPKPYEPGGTASFTGKVVASGPLLERTFTPINYEKGFGSQKGKVQTISTNSIKRSGWKLPESSESVPLRDDRSLQIQTTSVRTDQSEISSDTKGNKESRITSNTLEDLSPSITYLNDSNDYLTVWSHKDVQKNVSAGRDIFFSTAGVDEFDWGNPAHVTDDRFIDTNPSIASNSNGTSVMVWSRITKEYTDKDLENPDDQLVEEIYNNSEIFYALYNSSGWSEPRNLTGNNITDISPEVVYSEGGNNWQVVWESDQDGNITSLNDSRVHRISLTYNYSRGEINVSNKTSISNATDPAIAGTDKESFDAAMAYFKTESGKYNDGKIIYSRLEDENGEGQIRKKYFEENISRFKDLTVNGNSLAWVEGPVSDPQVYYSSNARIENPEKINISNLTSIRDIKLQSTENNSYKFLTYRGKSADGKKAVYYKMRANDSWIRDRPLTSNKSGFVYWQPSTTVGENNSKFVTAFAGRNFSKDNQNNDIFSVQHEFRPDLKLRVNINNETENLTSSDKVEVQLNVSNVGDGPTKKNVGLVISNGTQNKIYDQMFSQISAGETRTNETLVELGERGVLKSSIDIQDRIKELSEDNNNVTIRPLKPNLEVYSVNSSRKDDQAELNITFNNTGEAIAENISYVVNVNNSEVENGSIDVLRNASSKKVSINISADKVSAFNLTSIEINPDRNIKETNFSDNTWEGRLLRPDLSLRKSRFSYYKYEDRQEKVIEIRIDNSGGTKASTTVNILDNQTVLAQETVSIGPSSKSNLSNSTFVNISSTNIIEDQRYTVAAPVEYDRNNRNNAVSLGTERSFNQISADEDPEKGGGGGGSGGGGGGFALPSNENENNKSQSGGADANSTDKNKDSINDTENKGDENSIKVSKQIGKEETVEFGIQEKLNHSSLSKIEVESNTSGVLNISYQGLQKDKPEEVSRPQSKEIYNYMEIKSSIDDKNLVRAKIRFRVDKKWLKTQEGNKEDITMKRYENGAWKSLETVFVNSSENNHKFKSFSSGFSYFSITLDENRSSGNKSQNDVEREKSRVDTYQVTLALLGILAFGLIIGIYWIRVYKE